MPLLLWSDLFEGGVGAAGSDAPWFSGEGVPGFAAGVDDGLVVSEETVGEVALVQVEPDALHRVERRPAAPGDPREFAD